MLCSGKNYKFHNKHYNTFMLCVVLCCVVLCCVVLCCVVLCCVVLCCVLCVVYCVLHVVC